MSRWQGHEAVVWLARGMATPTLISYQVVSNSPFLCWVFWQSQAIVCFFNKHYSFLPLVIQHPHLPPSWILWPTGERKADFMVSGRVFRGHTLGSVQGEQIQVRWRWKSVSRPRSALPALPAGLCDLGKSLSSSVPWWGCSVWLGFWGSIQNVFRPFRAVEFCSQRYLLLLVDALFVSLLRGLEGPVWWHIPAANTHTYSSAFFSAASLHVCLFERQWV